jgi:SAM-dependent methyltransferase
MYINEYDEWLTYYLPIPVKDLVVLDVGAGEGETARFYLEHGARKVICIEPDTPSFKLLEKNAAGKPIMCLNKKFELTDLKMDFDFMKMDIEGYEETLLSASLKQPCVIEVHGLQLRDKFMKAGYNIRNFPMYSEFGAVSYAYLNLPCSCKR